VIEISADASRITGPGRFPIGSLGDMQNEIRVSDDSTEAQTEESRTPEQATATVARMLANPRRVRRN
jgi:hypothetical protein